MNIGKYATLSGSSYIELPKCLSNSMKGLINVTNKDNKCFLWSHVRHLRREGTHLTRITKENKKIADTLNYSSIKFPVCSDDYPVIEDRFDININVFAYNKCVYPVYISNKGYDDHMDLLMIFLRDNECNSVEDMVERFDKGHYVYIKDFNRLMCNKNKNGHKKHFCKRCLHCFTSERVLNDHKSACLEINGEQSIKLSDESTSFKNYCEQIPTPFKIYADFES